MLEKIIGGHFSKEVKNFSANNPVEIPIAACVLCTAFSFASYQYEHQKNGQIPLAFSEISQTQNNFEKQGRTVPPLTMYYSVTNDVVMKVFEANNNAYKLRGGDGSNQDFANELEITVDPALRIHHQIQEYAPHLSEYASNARKSLDKIIQANQDLPPLIHAFDAAWDESHRDIYRTETYTDQSCSGTGKDRRCSTVLKTRQVYDHTVHRYDYDEQQGRIANELLIKFLHKYPDLHIAERLVPVTTTNADNEQVMWRTIKYSNDGDEKTPPDYIRLANIWRNGSNYETLMPIIESNHSALAHKSPEWASALVTSRSMRYSTSSRHDSGPTEFQIAEAAQSYAAEISESINTITNGISYAEASIPLLEKKIRTYIAVTLDNRDGDSDKLRDEIMDVSREVYAQNFKEGFDARTAKWEHVVLFGILGLVLGGGAGFAYNSYRNRNNREFKYY